MAQVGSVRLLRATADASFGTGIGVRIVDVIVTHKSNVRALANIREGSIGGPIRLPFDLTGTGTGRQMSSASIMDGEQGLPITASKALVEVSGASTVAYVYYKNV